MKKEQHLYDYYTGEHVINGLDEVIFYIKRLVPEDEQGRYHFELFNALEDAKKQILTNKNK
tara:strand:+ start:255 stop:437 length:183 start_codon:yes stop_codon:yes gene_type:complete